MRLSEIWIYPVKSCRGIALTHAKVVETGLEHDRSWMVVDERGRFLTQRERPIMAAIETRIDGDTLFLAHRDVPELAIPMSPAARADRSIRVWEHESLAHDEGEGAAAWLSERIDEPCRLVRMPDDDERAVGPAFEGRARTAFSDGYPLLLVSEASLSALNKRLTEPVGMDRFRPNLVVAGASPHAEDEWAQLRIGELHFQACKPCARCVVTTVDQRTGEAGKEPLRTLSTYRKRPGGVMFGQNLVHLDRGLLRVGDALHPVSRSIPPYRAG